MKRYLIPLALFVVLAAFLGVGLKLNPREVPSPLIDKPAPAFSLPLLNEPTQQLAAAELKGQVWVLNAWASWCAPCVAEHPYVTQMARNSGVKVIGLNYKDKPEDAQAWLKKNGNPYSTVVADRDGRAAIEYGMYGMPETFVVDKAGVIRFKHIGPITAEVLQDKLLPLLKKLNA
jgi:cytochrome c biogenesis protein CcmG, thiol:disulfide interchange protein DsbE